MSSEIPPGSDVVDHIQVSLQTLVRGKVTVLRVFPVAIIARIHLESLLTDLTASATWGFFECVSAHFVVSRICMPVILEAIP